jgi:hypothetical protein
MERSITLFFGEVIRRSSVITLTEDANVDAHDCRADITSHRAAGGREIMQVTNERRIARCVALELSVDVSTSALERPSLGTG